MTSCNTDLDDSDPISEEAVAFERHPNLLFSTGNLKSHYESIVNGGGKFYLSGMSSASRGLKEADLKDKPAEFAMPKVLLELSVESDRMFVY